MRGRGRWHGGARAVHVCGAVGSKGVWVGVRMCRGKGGGMVELGLCTCRSRGRRERGCVGAKEVAQRRWHA